MTVIVFEGFVRVCNLAGVCVVVKAGQTASVRNGDSSGLAVPAQALLGTLTDAVNSTNLGDGPGVEPIHHIGRGTAIAIGILALVPIVVIPVVATRGSSGTTPVRNPNCDPATQKCP